MKRVKKNKGEYFVNVGRKDKINTHTINSYRVF